MNTLHTIIVLCAYCKKMMNTKDGDGISGISHSICNSCLTSVEDIAKGWQIVSGDKEMCLQEVPSLNSPQMGEKIEDPLEK